MDIEDHLLELEQRRMARRGRPAGRCQPPIRIVLVEAPRGQRHGRLAAAQAIWTSAEAGRGAARRADQGTQNRSVGRGICQRAVDVTAHCQTDKGQTPVLQYSFSWKQLSVIAGVSFWRFYFRFFPGSIKSPQIVESLKALQRTVGRKMLIVWDRLQAHRSRLVKAYVEEQRGALYLPAYAP
jgi:hypothetical protein